MPEYLKKTILVIFKILDYPPRCNKDKSFDISFLICKSVRMLVSILKKNNYIKK